MEARPASRRSGHPNILKRLLVQVCGFNLGLLMRQLMGVGTPRSLQGRAAALVAVLIGLLSAFWGRVRPSWAPELPDSPNASSDLRWMPKQRPVAAEVVATP